MTKHGKLFNKFFFITLEGCLIGVPPRGDVGFSIKIDLSQKAGKLVSQQRKDSKV